MINIFKLIPFHLTKDWGYEDWMLSCYEGRFSQVKSTLNEWISPTNDSKDSKNTADELKTSSLKPLPRFIKEQNIQQTAGDFPLLIKTLQANEWLSVQIHPSNQDATSGKVKIPNNRGKTECWLILEAKPHAKVVWGLKKAYPPEQLQKMIEEKTILDAMHHLEVKAGDLVHVPAGTLHAIGEGIRLLEVQQSSDTTYRVYDFDRNRQVHVAESLLVLQTEKQLKPLHWENFFGKLKTPYFSVERGKLLNSLQKSTVKTKHSLQKKRINFHSYCIVVALKGSIVVNSGSSSKRGKESTNKIGIVLRQGESAIVTGLTQHAKKTNSTNITESTKTVCYCQLEAYVAKTNPSLQGTEGPTSGKAFIQAKVNTEEVSSKNTERLNKETNEEFSNSTHKKDNSNPFAYSLENYFPPEPGADEKKTTPAQNGKKNKPATEIAEMELAYYAVIYPFEVF